MAFRFPGVDVALCTVTWILLAVAGIYFGITEGHFPGYIAVAVLIGIAGLGMWFQVRSAGYLFGAVNAILAILGLLGMLKVGFSIKSAVRLAGMIYAAWIAFEWAANKNK